MESKQITPSVIARLMGLDELPPSRPIHKQQRVLSEDYLRKTASIGVREKRSLHEGFSFRMTAREHQEFKDIFEVPSIPWMDEQQHLSPQKGNAYSNLTGGNVSWQTFMEPKCLLMNEKLQHSKEYNDTWQVLDSDNDLLLRNLWEQGSFFTKHLHIGQGVPPYVQSGNIIGLMPSNASSHRKNEMCGKLERTERRNAFKSFQKPGTDLVPHSHEELGSLSQNSLKSPLQSEDDRNISHTRIVVLRPNLGKTPDTRSFVSSISNKGSQSSYRGCKDNPHSKKEEIHVEVTERKIMSDGMEPSGYGSRVSGKTANVIGKPMKQNARSSFTMVPRSGFRGDGTSLHEFVVMKPSSPDFINSKNQHQKSFSYWNRFSVAREAKKRLSEKRKTTERCQEIKLVNRSSTLGEMLAMPDHTTSPRNLDHKHGKDRQSNQFGEIDGDVKLCAPLGISSKDGWKGGYVKISPKSGSLPASASTGSAQSMTENEAFHCDWYMRPEEAFDKELHKSRKQNSDFDDCSEAFDKELLKSRKQNSDFDDCSGLRNSRLNSQNSVSIPLLVSENNHSVQEPCVTLRELKNKVKENDQSEQSYGVPKLINSSCTYSDSVSNHEVQKTQTIQPGLNESFEDNSLVPGPSIVNVASIHGITNIVSDSQPEDAGLSFGIITQPQTKPMASIFLEKDGDSASCDSVASNLEDTSVGSPGGSSVSSQCTRTNPESSVSLEEAYQPSPVSVLELPFKGEISSGSKCFESVTFDIQGLSMLQLLKSESPEAYPEGPEMVISSNEDMEEESTNLYDEKRELWGLSKARESRDFAYLVDVLVEAGFCGNNLDMNLETWHSPECPMSRSVFEKLEKKYGGQTSWKRSERMLLFDCINSGLIEILWPCTESHMLIGSVTKRLCIKLSQGLIEEELWKMLLSQEKEMNKKSSGKVSVREVQLELGDDIAIIVREIESLLLDELVAEFVSMENF